MRRTTPSVLSPKTTTTTTAVTTMTKPREFRDMQSSMEGEMERRRHDWEKEVSVMQADFFDMKTDDVRATEKKEAPTKTVQMSTGTSAKADAERRREDAERGRAEEVKAPEGEEGSSSVVGRVGAGGRDVFDISHAKSLYATSGDGVRRFSIRFDVHGFAPEDVQIETTGSQLTVTAKHLEEAAGGGTNIRSFNRHVEVPRDVDLDSFISYLSDDGILTIEGRVEEEKEEDRRPRYVGAPTPAQPTPYRALHPADPSETSTGEPQIKSSEYGKLLKLVVDIGRDYVAGDITVALSQSRIAIRALHEETVGGRSSTRRFSRDFDLPQPVEGKTVVARLAGNGKLYVGGSLAGNRCHEMVEEALSLEMPLGGKTVKVSLE